MKNNKNKKEFAISNSLIRTPNNLSLNDLQIFGVILSNFDWEGDEKETIRIEVDTKEIIKVLTSDSKNLGYYYESIANFQSRMLIKEDLSNEIDEITGKPKEGFRYYMMIPMSEVKPDKCTFEINYRLNKYLQRLKQNFTVFKIANTVNFTSRFSYVLYMNLCSWNDHRIDRNDPLDERRRFYTTNQLKEMFNIGDNEYMIKQKNGTKKFNRSVFERYVIVKAINEINKYTNIQVTWRKEYEGRNVSKYVFEWIRRDGIDYETGLNKL